MSEPKAPQAPTPAPRPAGLGVQDLRWRCLLEDHAYLSDAPDKPTESTLGQGRAVEALKLGLNIDAPGFNVFVAGPSGSGRTFTVRGMLENIDRPSRLTEDRVFVHNFRDRDRPRLLRLERGQGRPFKTAMKEFVGSIPEHLEQTLQDEAFVSKRKEIVDQRKVEAKTLLSAVDEEITDAGYVAVEVQQGQQTFKAIVYEMDGEPVPFDALRRSEDARGKFISEQARALRSKGEMLPTDEAERDAVINKLVDDLEAGAHDIHENVEDALMAAQRIERLANEEVHKLEQDTLRTSLTAQLNALKETFASDGVEQHLDAVLDHMLDNLHLFHNDDDDDEAEGLMALLAAQRGDSDEDLWVYEVNVVQQADTDEKPIVFERHPTFTNLFGTIERKSLKPNATEARDFTGLRAGSLLRADGGYLVLYARDVLLEPGVWRTLVRTLSSRQLEIQTPETSIYLLPSALKPDPIPLNLKVILIGDLQIYHLLLHYEGEFKKIFKVKAEFDSSIDRSKENLGGFVETIRALVERQSLLPPAPEALGVLLEEAVRLAGRRNRVSTEFGQMADVLSEAQFWAQEQDPDAKEISPESVQRALQSRRSRHALADEHVSRYIQEQVILIDTEGKKSGQINGLAVYGLGDHYFGKPSRITASVGAGAGGLVNIEREARLSGPSHDKGVMILAGYLRNRYGRDRPLAITASLAFEQSYGGVDGDSASLAELFALMSSLTDLPIDQGIAITGSMNQKGDAQAIGGVNEKIEGFFGVCKARGLNGNQGCIIPEANIEGLMLNAEVVKACEEGKFTIWSVKSADEAMPILFGITAESLHEQVAARLEVLSKVPNPGAERTVERDPGGYTGDIPKPPKDPRPPTPTEEKGDG